VLCARASSEPLCRLRPVFCAPGACSEQRAGVDAVQRVDVIAAVHDEVDKPSGRRTTRRRLRRHWIDLDSIFALVQSSQR